MRKHQWKQEQNALPRKEKYANKSTNFIVFCNQSAVDYLGVGGRHSNTHWVIWRHVVVCGAEFCHQFICHFVVGGNSLLLHLLTHFHGEMSQAFSILLPFLTTLSVDRTPSHINTYANIFETLFPLPQSGQKWFFTRHILKRLVEYSPWWPRGGVGRLTLSEELGTRRVWTVYQNGIWYCCPLRCSNHLLRKR